MSDGENVSVGGRPRRRRRRRGSGNGSGSGSGNGPAKTSANGAANGSGNKGSGNGGGRSRGSGNRGSRSIGRYRRQVEDRLFGKKADRARLRLEERLRESRGTPNFFRTFREYLKGYGMPEDIGLLTMLLDLEAERDVLKVTEAIDGKLESVSAEQKSLLRSRLRNLEMATGSDAVADAATDLLERL